jgi:hypothetical protein
MHQRERRGESLQQSAIVRPCARLFASTPAAALALSICATAHAETVRLHWSAAAECPEQTRFEAEVRARTRNATFVEATSTGRLFVVDLATKERGFEGRLQIREGPGPSATRTFEGDTCAEVVSALALLTALAIDPEASSGPIDVLPGSAASPPVVRVTTSVLPTEAARPHAPAESRPSSWQVGVGGRLMVEGWVAPRPLPGFDVFGEVWREGTGPIAPGMRLGLGGAGSSSGEARWRWYVARLDACPVRAKLGWRLLSQSCAGMEIGALRAEGVEVASPRSSTKPWLAARLTTGLLVDTSSAYAGIEGGLVAPVTRYRFYFDHPWTEVHRVPVTGAVIEIMVGAHLP